MSCRDECGRYFSSVAVRALISPSNGRSAITSDIWRWRSASPNCHENAEEGAPKAYVSNEPVSSENVALFDLTPDRRLNERAI